MKLIWHSLSCWEINFIEIWLVATQICAAVLTQPGSASEQTEAYSFLWRQTGLLLYTKGKVCDKQASGLTHTKMFIHQSAELYIDFNVTFVDVWITHINDSLPVANQKVPEQTSLVEVTKSNHVIYAINGWSVHVLQGAILFLDLVLLRFTL